jgi:hypothetical protein
MERSPHRLDVALRRRAGRPGRGRVALGPGVAVALAALLVALPVQGGGRRRPPPPAPKVEHDAPQPAAGDFVHTPAAEQAVNTPLPVYVEPGAGVEVGRVVLKYKGAEMTDWRRLDMKSMGAGWGALIPCEAVKAGAMLYWFQGFDKEGEPSATSGDPQHPYSVPVRQVITSEAAHLPKRAAPQACAEDAGQSPEGPVSATPAAGAATEEEEPLSHAPDEEAKVRATHAPEPTFARWWLGVAGAIDFVSLPAADDACSLNASAMPTNGAGYYCTNPDGTNFPTRAGSAQNASLIAGQAGHTSGGLHPGDLRALLALDYALSDAILVGVRLGYVLDAYPAGGAAVTDHRAFGPHVHGEGRVAYVFGDAPLTRTGFAPTVFVGLGAAPFDGHVTSEASMKSNGNVPISQPVELWRTSGPWFLAVGGGARYQLSQREAFVAQARLNVAFGGAGALLTYGPEIAFQYGF